MRSADSHCEALADLASARREWEALALRSGDIFATWEWADTWWRHFGAGRELRLLACKRDGETFAIAPLYASRRGPLRILRFLGHGPGDSLGPVCHPADRRAAGEALVQALSEDAAGPWHVLIAERLPCGPLGEAIGGRVLQSEASPALEIGNRSWDDYLASQSRNLREKLRRNTRKIERDHELRYRLCESQPEVDGALDALFRLHRARWSGDGAFETEVAAFHREFAMVALERGWLRLWTMEVDGEAVAAWYGFRLGSVEAYYQSGRDPRFDRFSVGFLMLMRTIRGAFEDGLERYAFLRGDEPYKDRFATEDDGLETRALGRGALARAGIACGAAGLRVPAVRRRVVAALR
jgi:CelD/BcsL family acetyltransferase involved in cellulose biosynthesis